MEWILGLAWRGLQGAWNNGGKEVGLIAIGWAFSLYQNFLTERSKERSESKQLKVSIEIELAEIRALMSSNAYFLAQKYGTDAEADAALQNHLRVLDSYDGPNKVPGAVERLRSHAARPPEVRAAARQADRASGVGVVVMSPVETQVLGSVLARLGSLPGSYQASVLDVQRHIGFFNHDLKRVEDGNQLMLKASDNADKRAASWTTEASKHAAQRAGIVVRKIDTILSQVGSSEAAPKANLTPSKP